MREPVDPIDLETDLCLFDTIHNSLPGVLSLTVRQYFAGVYDALNRQEKHAVDMMATSPLSTLMLSALQEGDRASENQIFLKTLIEINCVPNVLGAIHNLCRDSVRAVGSGVTAIGPNALPKYMLQQAS